MYVSRFKIALFPDVFWDGVPVPKEANVFRVGDWVVEIEVLDVHAGCSCSWSEDDVLNEAFHCSQLGSHCSCVPCEINGVEAATGRIGQQVARQLSHD
jgi:hypothetical protein